MKKIKSVVSATALLSVGGIGAISADDMLRPNDTIISEAFVGQDGIFYGSKAEASQTFVEGYEKKYVNANKIYKDRQDFIDYELENMETKRLIELEGHYFSWVDDVYDVFPITDYLLYGEEYVKASDKFAYLFEQANEMIDETTMDIYRAPVRSTVIIGDGDNETADIINTVKMNSLTSTYDQSMVDTSHINGYKFILPTANASEVNFNGTYTSTCKTANVEAKFINGSIKCNTFEVVDQETVYYDKETFEYSNSEEMLVAKRIAALNEKVEYRYEWMGKKYEYEYEIFDHISTLFRDYYVWNDSYYENQDTLGPTLGNYFDQNKDDMKITTGAFTCLQDQAISIDGLNEWLIDNYDSLVKQCT